MGHRVAGAVLAEPEDDQVWRGVLCYGVDAGAMVGATERTKMGARAAGWAADRPRRRGKGWPWTGRGEDDLRKTDWILNDTTRIEKYRHDTPRSLMAQCVSFVISSEFDWKVNF